MKALLNKFKALVSDGLLHILCGNYLTQGLGFIASIVAIRLITDKAEYASYLYADNIIAFANVFSGLGMSAAYVKYSTEHSPAGMDKAYFNYSFKWGGISQLVISVAIILGVYTFVDIPFAGAKEYIAVLSLLPLINFIIALNQSYNRAKIHNKFYATVGVVQTAVLLVSSVIFIKLFKVDGLLISRYVSVLVTVILSCKFIGKAFKGEKPVLLDKPQKKEYTKTSLSLMMSNSLSWLMPIVETFLVNNIIADEVTSANFKTAGLIPAQLAIVSSSISIYFFPKLMQIKDRNILKKEVTKVGLGTAGVVTLVTVAGMVLTPFIINILYGSQYADAVPLSYLLWVMRWANSAIRIIPLNMMIIVNEEKFNARMATASSLVQVVLDVVFIKAFGVAGVAIGAMSVYAVSGIIYWARFFKCCREGEKIS